jgi:hypothetical protein
VITLQQPVQAAKIDLRCRSLDSKSFSIFEAFLASPDSLSSFSSTFAGDSSHFCAPEFLPNKRAREAAPLLQSVMEWVGNWMLK